jgi:hypothetical protein
VGCGRFQQQIVVVQFKANTESAGCAKSLDCAHSRPLQPGLALLKLDDTTSLTGISFPPFPSFPILPSLGFRFGECGECGECFWSSPDIESAQSGEGFVTRICERRHECTGMFA